MGNKQSISKKVDDIIIYNFDLTTIITDLTKNLTDNEAKRVKILKRLNYVLFKIPGYMLADVDPEILRESVDCYNYYSNLSVPEKPKKDLFELFRKRCISNFEKNPEVYSYGHLVPFARTSLDEFLKKGIERHLTDAFVKNPRTYVKTCGLFNRVIKHLSSHLSESIDMIVRYKGGMAIKTTLQNLGLENLNECFSNSDNDTTISINPDTKDFDRKLDMVSDIVFNYLVDWDDEGMFDEEIAEIEKQMFTDDSSSEKFTFTAKHQFSYVFDYDREDRYNMDCIVYKMLRPKKFRISRNFIKIMKTDNTLEMFELIRVKIGFLICGSMYYAELLDISIPHCSSKSTALDFKYKSHFIPNCLVLD